MAARLLLQSFSMRTIVCTNSKQRSLRATQTAKNKWSFMASGSKNLKNSCVMLLQHGWLCNDYPNDQLFFLSVSLVAYAVSMLFTGYSFHTEALPAFLANLDKGYICCIMKRMSLFSNFTLFTIITTYAGIFVLRVFHYGFIYERPADIVLGCVPTVSISAVLILVVVLAERPILRRFEAIVRKGRKDKSAVTEKERAECLACYKKYDVAIAIGDAIGFLLGAGSTAIIEAVKGKAPFSPLVFAIIELQSVGMGFLCYSLNVFRIKRVLMAPAMREAGIQSKDSTSSGLSVAVGTCIYLTTMNMLTVPVGIINNPRETGFAAFIGYGALGAVLSGAVCFITYSLLIRKILQTEREVSRTLFTETQQLAASTRESAATSQEQSTAVKEIVATMQDSTALSASIGEKVKSVTELAQQSRNDVLSGNGALQDSVQNLLDIKDTNALTITRINELNSKISNIWDIVSIINVVADQTKIIAFNAELEASSSGEAGKNFHIVATEIRRLSDNIIDSIREIKERIDEIQQASDTLLVDSEKETSKIVSGYKNAKSLEEKFSSIMLSSERTAQSSAEILDYIGQLSSSSEQIFITLQQIAHGVESVSKATESISASSESVREIAGRL